MSAIVYMHFQMLVLFPFSSSPNCHILCTPETYLQPQPPNAVEVSITSS